MQRLVFFDRTGSRKSPAVSLSDVSPRRPGHVQTALPRDTESETHGRGLQYEERVSCSRNCGNKKSGNESSLKQSVHIINFTQQNIHFSRW